MNKIDHERLPGVNDWFIRILPMTASINKQIKGNSAYMFRSGKASISIVAAVVGLNGDSLVGGSGLVLSLDHPLACALYVRNGHKVGADVYRYLLSHGAISGKTLDLIALSGAVVLQVEHEVSADVPNSIYSVGGESHCIRCGLLVG
jgi:hypothetical protein